MAHSYRKGRLGGEIRKIISDLLLKDLKDPRLTDKMISVTDVDVSADGSYATVYITVLGGSVSDDASHNEKEEAIEGLMKASGFIRKTIGRRVKIRHVPELSFKVDESLEYGRHMSRVLDSLQIGNDGEKDSGDEESEDADRGPEEKVVSGPADVDHSRTDSKGRPVRDERGFDLTEEKKAPELIYKLQEDERTPDMKKIRDLLISSDSMYIFPHYVADGDAIGSCASLCHMMRKLGKEADILMEDEIPDNLKFMDKEYVIFATDQDDLPQRDLCIALDCSNLDRFPERQRLFRECGRRSACIDHHKAFVEFADVSLIDPWASATAELMYELYLYMGLEIDVETAEALYAGIVTDTGNFQYVNTTRKTHLITSDLYALGINTKKINIILYQSERPQKLKLHAMIMSHMQIFCNGRASLAYVTLDMYNEAGAKTSESDGINSKIRDINGVEVAVFLREKKNNEVKVGFRSKDYIDVAEICLKFGGGGHEHAAGCTMEMSMEESIPLMIRAVEDALKEYDEAHALPEDSETAAGEQEVAE